MQFKQQQNFCLIFLNIYHMTDLRNSTLKTKYDNIWLVLKIHTEIWVAYLSKKSTLPFSCIIKSFRKPCFATNRFSRTNDIKALSMKDKNKFRCNVFLGQYNFLKIKILNYYKVLWYRHVPDWRIKNIFWATYDRTKDTKRW